MHSSASEAIKRLGLNTDKAGGYYILENTDKYLSYVSDQLRDAGVHVMDIKKAIELFPWAKELVWGIIRRDKDQYTRNAGADVGYFIYAEPGAKTPFPVQTCLYISKRGLTQPVHNIIVADEGAILDVVTGCTVLTDTAFHIGVSEFYVRRDATIRYLMVHNWERGVEARPRTGALVDEGGKFISYYANFFPARLVQSKPVVYVKDHGYTHLSSVLMAQKGTRFDIGAEAHLQGEGASAEIVSRSVLTEGGYVRSPLEIYAEHPHVRGHIDCKAIQLGKSDVDTVPRLVSKYPDVDLSHEAYVGRLDRRKVEYLMSKGLTEEEATALIVRGFVRLDIPFVSKEMRTQFESIAKLIAERATG